MRQPPIPTTPTPYIGVITTPLPAMLTAQLGLSEGFGLVVAEVLPESPAAKAGLQRYDVLTKFNDQQLVDSNQLATLTFLRKAQEQKTTVKIDEKLLPDRRAFSSHLPQGGSFFLRRGFDGGRDDSPENFQRERGYDDRTQEPQEHGKQGQISPSAEGPQRPEAPSPDGGQPIPPEAILREVRPGGVARIHILQGDGNVTYNTANAKVFVKDTDGEIEITSTDGKRSLTARDAKGETVFEGPIDTEEQRKALPETIRKKLELIEVQTKLAQAHGAPVAVPTPGPDVQ
jgi:hypothetical protein